MIGAAPVTPALPPLQPRPPPPWRRPASLMISACGVSTASRRNTVKSFAATRKRCGRSRTPAVTTPSPGILVFSMPKSLRAVVRRTCRTLRMSPWYHRTARTPRGGSTAALVLRRRLRVLAAQAGLLADAASSLSRMVLHAGPFENFPRIIRQKPLSTGGGRLATVDWPKCVAGT